MSNPESSLPDAWVERIFATMRATYGASFDRQWECPVGVDPVKFGSDLKAHWGRELRGFQQNPAAIGHALDHLPEHPPNLVQFRTLCTRRPDAAVPALPAPKPDPARVAEIVSGIARPAGARHPKQWARDLLDRQKSGERIPIAHLTMARAALEFEPAEQGSEWQ